MKMYRIKELAHKVINNGEEQFVSDGFTDAQEITIEDLEHLGFHFTPQKNSASISSTGLRPQIGANSSGDLGKEAIEKTFFANGINGAMQIFNRTINICGEVPLVILQEDKEKRVDLSETQKDQSRANENLSIIEAFEFARRYMSGNRHFVFDLVEPVYEKQIDEENIDAQIASINSRLNGISNISVQRGSLTSKDIKTLIETLQSNISKLEVRKLTLDKNQATEKEKNKVSRRIARLEMVKSLLESDENEILSVAKPKTTIEGLDTLTNILKKQCKDTDSKESTELIKKVNKLRAAVSIGIRRESKKLVDDEIRGKVKTTSLIGANFERIDFNEDAISWIDFQKHPHNCHTLVIDKEYGIDGITEPEGVKINASDLKLLSLDGMTPATSIEVIRSIYESLPEERREDYVMKIPGRRVDSMIIGKFFEYVDLYENYKDSPDKFFEETSKLQSEVARDFPNFGHKSTPEELKKIQEEILIKRENKTSKEASSTDDYEL